MVFKIKQSSLIEEWRELVISHNETLSYLLRRDQFKTLRLRIRKNNVKSTSLENNQLFIIEVKAPKKCAQKYIENFLIKKFTWIKTKLAELTDKGSRPELDFRHGASFFSLGKACSFFYKHSLFTKDLPSTFFQKRVFGNTLSAWEYFAKLPLDEARVSTASAQNTFTNILTGTENTSSILSQIVPRNASYDSYFLKAEDACCAFLKGANTAHKNFSFQFPFLNTDLQTQNKEEYTKKAVLLCIKTKIEDFSPTCKEYENQNLSSQKTIDYPKSYYQEKFEKSLRTWRKKSAHLFLEFCFDTVWQGLCGELKDAPFQIPETWKNTFQKLQKPHFNVKNLSRRFGSCAQVKTKTKLPHNFSSQKEAEITLAVHLISFPLGLIEYVIIHECCHLIFMDHSKNFYALMEHCCPKSLLKRELLWKWSANHVQF